jgi:hypothetical protein
MAFKLYEKYPFHALSERGTARLLYREPLTHLFRTKDGMRLVTAVARPPSWRERIESEVPYFLDPEHFEWDSRMRHWVGGDPVFDPNRGVDPPGYLDVQLFVAPRAEAADGNYFYVGTGRVGSNARWNDSERYLIGLWVDPSSRRRSGPASADTPPG